MKRKLLFYPDKRLYTKAKPVVQIDERIITLVDDMLETMYHAKGVGLAATQVDVHERVIVIDVSETRDQPLVLINPTILEHSEERVCNEEGCLSVPDIYDDIERWDRVKVEAIGRDGQPYQLEADGLLGRCIQHEMDHLDGNVFVDYLSLLKRNRIKTKMQKKMKELKANQ